MNVRRTAVLGRVCCGHETRRVLLTLRRWSKLTGTATKKKKEKEAPPPPVRADPERKRRDRDPSPDKGGGGGSATGGSDLLLQMWQATLKQLA